MPEPVYYLVVDGRRGGLHIFLKRAPDLAEGPSDNGLYVHRGWVTLRGQLLNGSSADEERLGRDPDDDSCYRVFASRGDLVNAGFHPLPGPLVIGDWSEYEQRQ
jgi:hypothetical protein